MSSFWSRHLQWHCPVAFIWMCLCCHLVTKWHIGCTWRNFYLRLERFISLCLDNIMLCRKRMIFILTSWWPWLAQIVCYVIVSPVYSYCVQSRNVEMLKQIMLTFELKCFFVVNTQFGWSMVEWVILFNMILLKQ